MAGDMVPAGRRLTDQICLGALAGAVPREAVDEAVAAAGKQAKRAGTPANAEALGCAGSGDKRSAFPKVRVVTVSECGSHAVVDAAIGGQDAGEQALARRLYPRLAEDWLLIADP